MNRILELLAYEDASDSIVDDAYEEGKEAGLDEGRDEGIETGKEEEFERLQALYREIIEDGIECSVGGLSGFKEKLNQLFKTED